jgi:hypothetical protein
MLRGVLGDSSYRAQFSGHETFPLRHLWLRKAYEAVAAHSPALCPKSVFTDPDAIVRFGVGRNMVTAIRHWAIACGVIEEATGGYRTLELGDLLLGTNGFDPYLEHPASPWLIHWLLAGRALRTTTWYWAFNYFPNQSFEREQLAAPIIEYCNSGAGRDAVAAVTIKRDVECFVRSYVPRADSDSVEELTEPVLGELGLIHAVGTRLFEFRRGPKPTLPSGIFLLGLLEFWERHAKAATTLAFESLMYEAGSPGRVFKLDENSLGERLIELDQLTHGALKWSDTAGLRQVVLSGGFPGLKDCLQIAYRRPTIKKRAA